MTGKLVFDIETKNSFADVGGRENFRNLDVSVVGVYSYGKDEYFCFDESEFDKFGEVARSADLIITFNGRSFDIPILEKYFNFKFSALPHYDIFEEVTAKLGRRIGLGALAEANLEGGEGKTATGMDAIRFYQEGKIDELKKYCLQDVKVTKGIFDLIKTRGYLWIPDKHKPQMDKLEVVYKEKEKSAQGSLL